ncbi:MAG: hypothetical protein HQK65_12320 [Desulfamplus sp.]|nr:hypothetical protein [Desulfamplus sp.]
MASNQNIAEELRKNEVILQVFSLEDIQAEWRLKTGLDIYGNPLMCQANPSNVLNPADQQFSYSVNSSMNSNMVSYSRPNIKSIWSNNHRTIKNVANYISPGGDTFNLGRVIYDLGLKGKAVLKSINGKQYVIFKGSTGSRNIFKGTRYLSSNPQVIKMGIGRSGLKSSAISGGILSIVIFVGFDIVNYILNDEATMADLLGNIASDIIKIGVSTIIGALAGLAVGTVTTIAAGPIVAAIGVGILAGLALDSLDEKYGLTDKLIASIEVFFDKMQKEYEEKEKALGRERRKFERALIYRLSNGFDIDNPAK